MVENRELFLEEVINGQTNEDYAEKYRCPKNFLLNAALGRISAAFLSESGT